jgi:hypothetical protein
LHFGFDPEVLIEDEHEGDLNAGFIGEQKGIEVDNLKEVNLVDINYFFINHKDVGSFL